MPMPKQLWQRFEQSSDCKPDSSTRPQRQYTQQHFGQTFIHQRQNYPYNQRRQTLSPAVANHNSALHVDQNSRLASFNFDAPNNPTHRNAPCQPGIAYQPNTAHQPVPYQSYQSNPSYRGYKKSNKKRVY